MTNPEFQAHWHGFTPAHFAIYGLLVIVEYTAMDAIAHRLELPVEEVAQRLLELKEAGLVSPHKDAWQSWEDWESL
jgi:predicted Rossmann fold nucleotide-binding protein DprA/Smf involved in DNA uptake